VSHEPPHPKAILNAMKRMIRERNAWDEDPEAGCFYRVDDGSVETFPFLIAPAVWHSLGDPKKVLRFIEQMLSAPANEPQQTSATAVRNHTPDSLCGTYLRCEGWTAPKHRREEMARRRQAGHRLPRFKEMPDRVEMRMCTGVDATGRVYMAVQERNQPEMDALYEGMDGATGLGGAVPDLLKQLTTLLTTPVAVSPADQHHPARPEQ
jgi:hypothetical protein